MKEVVKKCARLPLAIVIVASSMRGIDDVHEWRTALNSLKSHTDVLTGMEKEVLEKLKFSYYRLSKQFQECLLFCALYPEDYPIKKGELINLLISEGIIGSTESLLSANDHGYTVLNKLENACLLMQGICKHEVVMHDLVRDMCLDIIGGRFLVKCCLKSPPDEFKYTEDVEKLSLIGSEFEELPSHIASCCSKLSTLLLSRNKKLTRIPHSCFEGLRSLKVLDLSYTSILELPNSVTNLVSLNALVLRRCCGLRCLPCLTPLKALKKLDLYLSGVEEAPEGLGDLVHLTYLDFQGTKITTLPHLIFWKLVKLQHLCIGWTEITMEDVRELKNLELFQAVFAKLEEFNEYVISLLTNKGGPSVYNVKVSCGLIQYEIRRDIAGRMGISWLDGKYKRESKRNRTELMFPQDVEIIFPSPKFVEVLDIGGFQDNCSVLPELVRATSLQLHMLLVRSHYKKKHEESSQSKGLFDVNLLFAFSNLKTLRVYDCAFIEELISTSPSVGVFNHPLEKILIFRCDKLVRLLEPKFLSCFQYLEWIRIHDCVSLESIISSANPIEKGGDNVISFPKLRHLFLVGLSNLRSICDNGTLICPSIETIHIARCPKLKRFPLQLQVLDDSSGRLVPLQSCLKVICGDPTWWASLDWDHPHDKTLLQPYFKPCQRCFEDLW